MNTVTVYNTKLNDWDNAVESIYELGEDGKGVEQGQIIYQATASVEECKETMDTFNTGLAKLVKELGTDIYAPSPTFQDDDWYTHMECTINEGEVGELQAAVQSWLVENLLSPTIVNITDVEVYTGER